MNKEMLQKRLKEIDEALARTMANYNMLEGGKQECLYMIHQLEKKEKDEGA